MRSSGDVIAGRYRLVAQRGSGAMGEVWTAEHLALKAPVAIKLLRRDIVATHEARRRFEREARAAAAIRGPHVVHIEDHGMHETAPFIVMELLEGESLAQRLKRTQGIGPRATLRVVTHIGRALAKAHALGVVHRDVKPANIFVTGTDDEEIVKLLDFGVVKITSELEALSQTKSGAIVGTPLYMSPEQLRAKPLDHRSDLWSLAIVAFECLCGAPPFSSDSLADLIVAITRDEIVVPSNVARVPDGFDRWFAHATERDVTKRFQTTRDLVDALRSVLESAPSLPPPAHVTSSVAEAPTLAASIITSEKARTSRRLVAVGVGVGGLVVALGIGRALLSSRVPLAVPLATPAVTPPPPPPPLAISPAAMQSSPTGFATSTPSMMARPTRPTATTSTRPRPRAEPSSSAAVQRLVPPSATADNPLAF